MSTFYYLALFVFDTLVIFFEIWTDHGKHGEAPQNSVLPDLDVCLNLDVCGCYLALTLPDNCKIWVIMYKLPCKVPMLINFWIPFHSCSIGFVRLMDMMLLINFIFLGIFGLSRARFPSRSLTLISGSDCEQFVAITLTCVISSIYSLFGTLFSNSDLVVKVLAFSESSYILLFILSYFFFFGYLQSIFRSSELTHSNKLYIVSKHNLCPFSK